jgi:transmembrane sensor
MSNQEYLVKVVRYLNDPQNAELQKEIESLKNESEYNNQTYEQIVLIWNKSNLQKLESIDTEEALAQLKLNVVSLREAEDQDRHYKTSFLFKWISAAASILLVIAVGYYSLFKKPKVEYITKSTQSVIDSVTLADGSKVYLDNYSSIKYPKQFNGDIRDVNLTQGQAFFKIHKNPEKPFVVNINQSSVTVLGTSFNIDSRNGQIAVNVSTGKVKFQAHQNNDAITILPAGTGVVFYETEGKVVKLNSLVQNNKAWLTHELNFVDTPLPEVFSQLEDCYKIKIGINGSIARSKKLNASFSDSPLNDILEILQETYPIKIKRVSNDSLQIQTISRPQ